MIEDQNEGAKEEKYRTRKAQTERVKSKVEEIRQVERCKTRQASK